MTGPLEGLEVGYDIPARPGMAEAEVQTPALLLDLDALEANLRRMARLAAEAGLRLRTHGKMHRSVDVQRLQERIGGAVGVCCQKVSEAEAFVRGGLRDVMVTNEVRDPLKLDRLARLPLSGARLSVCVDDPGGVADLAAAVARHGTALGVVVEIDCGSGRCGVSTPQEAVALARAVEAAPGLRFDGLQAYHGGMQHVPGPQDRRAAAEAAHARTRAAVEALRAAGLPPATVCGGGTGSWPHEAASGLYTELQCGSYAFMDADYGRIEGEDGARLDAAWRNALFVLASVMSTAVPGRAVVDAGLKALAMDSGPPVPWGRPGIGWIEPSDEHGTLSDPQGALRVGDRLRLVPGHCDPTVNLHDWYVGVRDGVVECLWPVTARGKGF